jgi:competence protein ComGC
MSKQCLVCGNPNPSDANHCIKCGKELPNKELHEEDRLRIELHEAKVTIQGLNKALAEIQNSNAEYEEAQKTIADYGVKMTNLEKENSKYKGFLSEKEKLAIDLSKKFATTKKRQTTLIVLLSVIGVILLLIVANLNQEIENNRYSNESLEGKVSSLEKDNYNLKQRVNSLEVDNSGLNQRITSISNECPVEISSLKVANVYNDGTIETDYGSTLYSSTTMYLKPQIEYVLKRPSITLYQKLYKEGELSQGTSSPEGYSAKCEFNISNSGVVSLIGWGSETKGNWSAGNYRYEIWYNSTCLKTVDFTIY